jgi:hypothetical protein
MKTQAIALTFLCAFGLSLRSNSASASIDSPTINPPTPRKALCKAVIAGGNPQQKEVDALIDSGLIFSAIHAEAILRAAKESKLINESSGDHERNYQYNVNRDNTVTKDQLRKLSRVLSDTDPKSDDGRNNFAETVLNTLENDVLKTTQELIKDRYGNVTSVRIEGTDSLQRLKVFDLRKDGFYFQGSLRPSAEDLDKAWAQLSETLKKPGGRALLKKTLVASNGTMANMMTKMQLNFKRNFILAAGGVAATAVGAYFGYGMDLTFVLPGATAAASAAVGSGVSNLMQAYRPIAALRMKLFKSAQKKRIHALLAQAKADGVIDGSVATDSVDSLEDLPENAANQIFDREMVTAHTNELKEIVPQLKSKDFEGAADFGGPIIGRVDQALDILALMSKRMSLLEADIDKLASVIAGGELKISATQANALVERALASSGQVVLDGAKLVDYSNVLLGKIEEHVTFASQIIRSKELAPEVQLELSDVSNELVGNQKLLSPQAAFLPVMMNVAQGQRSILRDLRTNLRGKKIQNSESMSTLTDAIAKLKKVRESSVKAS